MQHTDGVSQNSTLETCIILLTNNTLIDLLKKKVSTVLADVAQWIECQPVNQRVAGSIPSQGTCLGCGPGPQQEVRERQPHIDVSVPLFLLSIPSL